VLNEEKRETDNLPTYQRHEVLEAEIVNLETQNQTAKMNTAKCKEYNRGLQKLLDEIEKTNRLREQLMGQAIQEYWMDVNYYNSVVLLHNHCLYHALNRRVQFWTSYHKSDIYYRINPFSKKKKLQSEN